MKKLILTLGLIAGLNSLYAGPIHDAASAGDLEKIKSLVDSGIDPNDITGGHSPLTVASIGNKLEAIDLLISLGADINLVSVNRTPLLAAIEYDNTEAAYKLILKGASLDHIKGTRTTPLIAACKRGNETVIDLLLLKGVDINQKDKGGATAIHALADWSDDTDKKLSMLKKYVSEGANINEIASRYATGDDSESFVTPLEIAYDDDIIDFLIENGAKAATQVLDDRLSSLEQKVEQGSSGNTNPTSEWPRKMWEIDLGEPIGPLDHQVGNNNSIVFSTGRDSHWVTKEGKSFRIENTRISSEDLIYLDNKNLIYKTYGNREISINMLTRSDELVALNQINIKNLEMPSFSRNSSNIGLSKEGTKVTAWDFTPPTLASTDNEGGNGDNEAPNDRLVVKTAGPDISIATDGKLGGPAELQKSDDLKNWRRLGDVPEDANEVLVTPRDSGNEFFRLKRIDE
jgi:ankyrin repeat protein